MRIFENTEGQIKQVPINFQTLVCTPECKITINLDILAAILAIKARKGDIRRGRFIYKPSTRRKQKLYYKPIY